MHFGIDRLKRLVNGKRVEDAPVPTPEERDVAEIRASGLFDAAGYLARYPDVAAAGVDPVLHYLRAGASEGRDPGSAFDWMWYLGESPDASAPGVNPILHYLRIGRPAGRSPKALDEGQAFDSFSAATRSGTLPFAAQQRSGIDHVHFPLSGPTPAAADGLPAPPVSLSARIGSPDLSHMEAIGRGVRETIVRCLPEGFDFAGKRCLDYGCGIGRVIRYFGEEARRCEFWGCDIDGPSIRWLTEQMSPPFRFYRISPAPSLPFEDSSFDLVYAIGVFSQIYDDWHQLGVELRRILKPGGTFVMSHPGQTSFEDNLSLPFASNRGLYLKNPFSSWSAGGPLVFTTPEWTQRYWGAIFDIEFIAPNGLLDYETLCVMRKPDFGAPMKGGGRIVEVATRQEFNPDAVGALQPRFDRSRPFLESFGIEAAEAAEIEGHIAMRGDVERLDLAVDGEPVRSETEWMGAGPYRGKPEVLQRAFRTRFSAAGFGPERRRLSVTITGRAGVRHEMSIPFRVVPRRGGAPS